MNIDVKILPFPNDIPMMRVIVDTDSFSAASEEGARSIARFVALIVEQRLFEMIKSGSDGTKPSSTSIQI